MKVFYFAIFLNYSNYFMNPIVYALLIPEFRQSSILFCSKRQVFFIQWIANTEKRYRRFLFEVGKSAETFSHDHSPLAFKQESSDTKLWYLDAFSLCILTVKALNACEHLVKCECHEVEVALCSGSSATIPDQIGIWRCWFLRRGENRSTQRKTSWSKGENQQQNSIHKLRRRQDLNPG